MQTPVTSSSQNRDISNTSNVFPTPHYFVVRNLCILLNFKYTSKYQSKTKYKSRTQKASVTFQKMLTEKIMESNQQGGCKSPFFHQVIVFFTASSFRRSYKLATECFPPVCVQVSHLSHLSAYISF